ncbi:MAG: hypothetical protein ACE15D_10950 [Candidatus Eisenbacteria bacterium]
MMGVLKGVADYYGLDLDAATVYGLSGHAFLINIHTQICPSGPYVWKQENARPLIEGMGLRMVDLGFFDAGAKESERAEVEGRLYAALDRAIPCSLVNLENQILTGYDRTGFFCAQPWAPKIEFPPGRLTFGSWEELGKEFHVDFYAIERAHPVGRREAIRASLEYAIDLWTHPSAHSMPGYGVGPSAYDNWIAAVPESGSSHGNWWNATVWGECRRMAAEYFAAIAKGDGSVAGICEPLSGAYRRIAENLEKASSKTMDAGEKVDLLRQAKVLEAGAVEKIEKLAEALRAG